MDNSADSTTAQPWSASSLPDRPADLIALVRAIAVSGDRRPGARALASHFGAKDALAFACDEELGVLLPALGFPQTLVEIYEYRKLIERALAPGMASGELIDPEGRTGPAVAVAAGTAILFFGIREVPEAERLAPYLELLKSVYEPERKRLALEGKLAVVTDRARDVQTLATQLDRARHELEQRVRERTEELEAALKEAEGFNYSIAHDLRAPLRAISTTSSILFEELDSSVSEDNRKLLQRQVQNVARLGRLIDELLRLSRFSRVEVRRMPLDMTGMARSVAAEVDPSLRVEVQDGMTAEGDPGLLRTVLHNLIGNAGKFSPPASTIYVGQSSGVFWVRDEGIGFDVAFAHKIFLPFERLVNEREFPGTGIGLANVERIIKRHGGKVWAQSQPGQGATFFFTLP